MTDLERDPITRRLEQATQRIRLSQLSPNDFDIAPIDANALRQKIQQLGFGKGESLLPQTRQRP